MTLLEYGLEAKAVGAAAYKKRQAMHLKSLEIVGKRHDADKANHHCPCAVMPLQTGATNAV
jgi:hypothetical protein